MNNQTHDILGRGITRRLLCATTTLSVCLVYSLFGLSLLASQVPANAQSAIDPQREYNVKAVSLYAIGRYVNWPDSVFPQEQSPFIIGIFGGNPFGSTLDRIAQKKTIHGRTILVQKYVALEECGSCHILFITRSTSPSDEARLLESLRGRPILLVGESTGFATRGGMINFFVEGNNVRFELNADQALQAKLSLNAKMHSLGTHVSSRH